MIELLDVLNSLSPLGVIALLGITVYTLVQQHRGTPNGEHLRALNHLGQKLDKCGDTLHRIELVMQRMVTMQESHNRH